MMKVLEVEKRLNKAGTKTILEPGSVSRLAGSAHRWVELYAGGVQRKTAWSRTDCSVNGNNRFSAPNTRNKRRNHRNFFLLAARNAAIGLLFKHPRSDWAGVVVFINSI
jgi:hypothetical protein